MLLENQAAALPLGPPDMGKICHINTSSMIYNVRNPGLVGSIILLPHWKYDHSLIGSDTLAY